MAETNISKYRFDICHRLVKHYVNIVECIDILAMESEIQIHGEYYTQTWEFKGEFNNTEKVYIGIVDGEVNKDNPKKRFLYNTNHQFPERK